MAGRQEDLDIDLILTVDVSEGNRAAVEGEIEASLRRVLEGERFSSAGVDIVVERVDVMGIR